jgi:hypothetical protein
MIVRAFVVAFLLGVQLGCAARGPTFGFQRNEAEEDQIAVEYAPYRSKGRGSIAGRAFLRTSAGNVYAARQRVVLTPVTSLSERLVEEGARTGQWSTDELTRHSAVLWSTRTDMAGTFEFNQLPPGEYFLVCKIPWSSASGAGTTDVVGRVRIAGDERIDFLLSGALGTAP